MIAYINVETVPPLGTRPDPSRVSVPKRWKDKDTIREHQESHAREAWEKMATNPWQAQVFVSTLLVEGDESGADWGDVPAGQLVYRQDIDATLLIDMNVVEKHLTQVVEMRYRSLLERHDGRVIWCAYNGCGFDYPMLWMRGLKYGCGDLARWMMPRNAKYGDEQHWDPMVKLGGGKLDEWATFFNIKQDNPITGAQISECLVRGQHDQIVRHTTDRVAVLRDITRRLVAAGVYHP
jgi:hypothetical protein